MALFYFLIVNGREILSNKNSIHCSSSIQLLQQALKGRTVFLISRYFQARMGVSFQDAF